MEFIARIGLLVLPLIVIFALFEVRYETLRRRDIGSPSVSAQSTELFRVWCSEVLPCAPLLVLVLPCPGQWAKGAMRVWSTMYWSLEVSCFWVVHFRSCTLSCCFFHFFILWLIGLGFNCFCLCHMACCAVMIGFSPFAFFACSFCLKGFLCC